MGQSSQSGSIQKTVNTCVCKSVTEKIISYLVDWFEAGGWNRASSDDGGGDVVVVVVLGEL